MAVTIYYPEEDVNPKIIQGKKIAIIGYGSQAGMPMRSTSWTPAATCASVLREGSKSAEKSSRPTPKVVDIDTAAEEADVIMILTPDETQPKVYEEHIKDHLKAGDTLAFAHGFNIHYGYIKAPEDVNVITCAPKGPGHIVRRQFTEGSGVPISRVWLRTRPAMHGMSRCPTARASAVRSGIIKATFAEETEEDLFGEQAVLCGGLVELVKAGFETLVDAGYPPGSLTSSATTR